MIQGVPSEWDIPMWTDHIKKILVNAIQNQNLRKSAIELINRLGSRGFVHFKDFLIKNN